MHLLLGETDSFLNVSGRYPINPVPIFLGHQKVPSPYYFPNPEIFSNRRQSDVNPATIIPKYLKIRYQIALTSFIQQGVKTLNTRDSQIEEVILFLYQKRFAQM